MNTDNSILLKYVGENGDEAEIIPSFFEPLGFEEMFSDDKLYEVIAKVKSGNGKINDKIIDQDSTCSFSIHFHSDISIYVLVPDGWLPITFLNKNFLVPDRNFLSSIIQIRANNLKSNTKSTKWWLDFHKKSDIVINPILYAFEGNKRRKPTYDEFRESFNKAVNELTEYFPNAKIISSKTEEFYKASYSILDEMTVSQEDDINFLIKAAPLVASPYSDKQLNEAQDTIDKIAMEHNCLGGSFLYFLVISCLYEMNDNSIYKAARKVLKPKVNYSKEDAYNTISDINALILFVQSLSIFKSPFPICTCDKALAAFWVGLNPIKLNRANKKIEVELPFNKCLFPRLNIEQRTNLAKNIKNKKSV
ncbi:hypothetical protein [Desulfocicer niacini]